MSELLQHDIDDGSQNFFVWLFTNQARGMTRHIQQIIDNPLKYYRLSLVGSLHILRQKLAISKSSPKQLMTTEYLDIIELENKGNCQLKISTGATNFYPFSGQPSYHLLPDPGC